MIRDSITFRCGLGLILCNLVSFNPWASHNLVFEVEWLRNSITGKCNFQTEIYINTWMQLGGLRKL